MDQHGAQRSRPHGRLAWIGRSFVAVFLVAALAMLGGVVALVGWPGADGPTHLVPGERAGQAPESRPGPRAGG